MKVFTRARGPQFEKIKSPERHSITLLSHPMHTERGTRRSASLSPCAMGQIRLSSCARGRTSVPSGKHRTCRRPFLTSENNSRGPRAFEVPCRLRRPLIFRVVCVVRIASAIEYPDSCSLQFVEECFGTPEIVLA